MQYVHQVIRNSLQLLGFSSLMIVASACSPQTSDQDEPVAIGPPNVLFIAVIPGTYSVITVIRFPQASAAKEYSFAEYKRALVPFGNRL